MKMSSNDGIYKLEDMLYQPEYYAAVRAELYERVFRTNDYQNQKNALVNFQINGALYSCATKEFILTMIFMRVFIDMNAQELYNEDYFYECGHRKEEYFDRMITAFRDTPNMEKFTLSLAEVLMELARLAAWTNIVVGVSISLYELWQMAQVDKRLNEIFRTDLSSISSFSEMEERMDKLCKEAVGIMMEFENSSYRDMLVSGTINKNQFKQLIVSIGPRPSISGQIIPEIVNTNYLAGLRDLQDYYILMETTRKILIISHIQVRKSGYMTRKLSLLTYDNVVDKDVHDCTSHHLMPVSMISEDRLRRFRDRWFWDVDHEKYTLLSDQYIADHGVENFLGRTMFFRSPMTCGCQEGRTCPFCYGELSHINDGYHYGLIAILMLTPRIMQLLLSAKHLLQTRSQEYDWSPEWLEMFAVDQTEVIVREDVKAYLRIATDQLREDEDTGDLYFEHCVIEQPAVGLRPATELEFILPTRLYLMPAALEEIKNNRDPASSYHEINLKNYQLEPLFAMKVMNEEIVARLDRLKTILEDSCHAGRDDAAGLLDELLLLLENNNIPLQSVHAEIILKNLLRDGVDATYPADWSKEEASYQLTTLFGAILDGHRLTPGISFEEVKQQLLSPATYRKTGSSLLDPFYQG